MSLAPDTLDPRARHLLRSLIARYIRDGEPVGSQTLARHGGLDLSAATIRNILGDLEEAGYLEREKRGRRNHYVLHPDRPLRHPSNAGHTVGELIRALRDVR